MWSLRGVGRFGDAPGHLRDARIRSARASPRSAALPSTLPCGSSSTSVGIRYSNIEPDHERSPASRPDRIERPAERGPVADRHVALGDRPQAREARLGGEQVVEARVELLLGDAKADVEQVAARLYRKPKSGSIARRWQLAARSRQAISSRCVRAFVEEVGTRAGEGEQVAAEVAAVDRRHVGRRQRRERSRVVPVQEVAAMARAAAASVARVASRRSQQVARCRSSRSDARRPAPAGTGRCWSARCGARPSSCGVICRLSGGRWCVFGADAALEQAPGVARDARADRRDRLPPERLASTGCARLAHQVHSGAAAQTAHNSMRRNRVRRAGRQGSGEQQQRERGSGAGAAARYGADPCGPPPAPRPRSSIRADVGGSASTDKRPRDRIDEQTCAIEQLGELPQRAAQRAPRSAKARR